MPATIQLSVSEGSPAAQKVIDALTALGATVVQEGGEIRGEVPAGTCAVCGGVYALSRLAEKTALGGLSCDTCRGIASQLWNEAVVAAHRQLREIRAQLPQAVRDVRGGAERPNYYRGFE